MVVPGVVPDGAVSSVTSAHHIQAVSMATVMDHLGSASVTRTGEEYSVIKVCSVHYKTWFACEPTIFQAEGEVTASFDYGTHYVLYSTTFR